MKLKKIARIKKLKVISQLGIGIAVSIISVLLVLSYYSQNVGNFTISLHSDLYKRGLSLSETIDFKDPTSRLAADVLLDTYPIGHVGFPEKIPEVIKVDDLINLSGPSNGLDYLAYSFYIRNAGEETISYSATLKIDDVMRGVDEAIRVGIIKVVDEEISKPTIEDLEVYAKPQSRLGDNPGEPEPGSIPFHSRDIVYTSERFDLDLDIVDRYIIIIWLHGEDPDCNDSILEGNIKLSMVFNVIE